MTSIILATTTFYKTLDDVRFRCALKTVTESMRCGYPIIVIDDSPVVEVAETFENQGIQVFRGLSHGMGASRRQTVQKALEMGAKVVVWLEPEKYPIVPLLRPCIEMVASGQYDLVIPRRRTLTGYPFYQHWSELETNWQIGEITGRPDLDYMIGPRVMNRRAAELFLEYEGQPYGDAWHGIFIVVVRAIAGGMRVGSKTVDYVHPPEQTDEEKDDREMNRKRDEQRTVLIETVAKEAARLGIVSLD